MRRYAKQLVLGALALCALAAWAPVASAHLRDGEPETAGFRELAREWQVGEFAPAGRVTRPADVPDIFGPGAVLTVGNVFMKITNFGFNGNPYTNYSTDASGQWPGLSGIEYLNYIALSVGAVNPYATDPTAVRRVSYLFEWRPATLDPEDRMYRSYDGIVNGQRFIDEDNDAYQHPTTPQDYYDEDFLDGRDNDGDGKIDEDFGAIGQEEWTCVMRDDTPQAIAAAAAERHVPLGVECRQSAWAYSIPGYTDFNVIQYDFYNRSGHILDSVYVGFRSDMDCGPVEAQNYWSDDFNLPKYPHGDFVVKTQATDLRLQPASDRDPAFRDRNVADGADLCPQFKIRVTGWSCADDNADDNKTLGIPSILLIDHTIDPTGVSGPQKVGLRAFRSFINGAPYVSGGSPTIDQQRFEFMSGKGDGSGHEGIDELTGFINLDTGENKGDYSDWSSIGPWLLWPADGHLQVTIAFAVQSGRFQDAVKYDNDYRLAVRDTLGLGEVVPDATALMKAYPSLANAIAAQIAFEGAYDDKVLWPTLVDNALINPTAKPYHGRETGLRAPLGQILNVSDCRDENTKQVNDRQYSWFDLDCDYCTGAYSKALGRGLFHRTWLAETPPPSPTTNLQATYNYTDNPDRRFIPAGDHQVLLAWDNLSETTPDPKSGQFDFRGYIVWKVSNWQRPIGSSGPYDQDWTQIADFRLFDRQVTNLVKAVCPAETLAAYRADSLFNANLNPPRIADYPQVAAGDTLWPIIFVPQTGEHKRVKLYRGDFLDHQSGQVLRPDFTVGCGDNGAACDSAAGYALGQSTGDRIKRARYPIGRYHIVDRNVKNGFVYFYSVTAYDSTGSGSLTSRKAAVEAEEVVPQGAADASGSGSRIVVVPNPYRGVKQINNRPSAWDLTPNGSDPTGTHIDFLGLPRGNWRIKIFTVSGDLVATLGARDAVNESIRPVVTDASGEQRPGYNRQADNENDGQARWNLISRNGQDVVSGIYLFTVDVNGTVKHRGKFVIIR